jgi:hypothetical protein
MMDLMCSTHISINKYDGYQGSLYFTDVIQIVLAEIRSCRLTAMNDWWAQLKEIS